LTMENVTANQARLYDNIEAGLHLVAPLIDRLEDHDCDDGFYLARATLGKALASLELLRCMGPETCAKVTRDG